MPADFSSEAHKEMLKSTLGDGVVFEEHGDTASKLATAAQADWRKRLVTRPGLVHGQLEPPSAIARWNEDGTLELSIPNQAPEMFQTDAAKVAGIEPSNVIIHSPMLGGFFGRHFLIPDGQPVSAGHTAARAAGRPVKPHLEPRGRIPARHVARPMGAVRFRAGLDASGVPLALDAVACGRRARPAAGLAASRTKSTVPPSKASPERSMRLQTGACANPHGRPGDHRLLALGRPFDERLLLRDVLRRNGLMRESRILRVANATSGG